MEIKIFIFEIPKVKVH